MQSQWRALDRSPSDVGGAALSAAYEATLSHLHVA